MFGSNGKTTQFVQRRVSRGRRGEEYPGTVRQGLTAGTGGSASRRRNARSDNESEQRHSIPRSESIPSK